MNDLVYLDICCFKRPFDDASQPRVRREAEAVAGIMDAVSEGRLRLVRSPAHALENERNPREDRRLATALWLRAAVVEAVFSAETAGRARELASIGFSPLDALHLAFAEQASAKWFATTDDALLNRARRHRGRLVLQVVGPDEVPVPGKPDPGEPE